MTGNQKYGLTFILLFTAFIFYSAWLYTRPEKHSISDPEKFSRGKSVWQASNCHVCHQLYGLGGFLGPDLTNVYSKRGETYISAFIQNGTDIMPAFHLHENELQDLLWFLKEMDRSGNSDPRQFKIRKDGNIEEK